MCAAIDQKMRVLAEQDRAWAKQHSRGEDGPDPDQPWPADGRQVFVRRVPKEAALERLRQAADKSRAGVSGDG